nr:MFS transporter [uncultured Acetobacterium sp.]
MNNDKLWTKDFVMITIISFLTFLVFYVLLAGLPLYLAGTLQIGIDKVGLVITLFLLAAILIRPFAGQWVSSFSQKKLLILSSIAFFICTCLYPLATSLPILLVLRVFHGLTFGILTTVKGTICAENIPDSHRGEGLSCFSLAMCLAMVFGPYIGLTLANIDTFQLAFILCILISGTTIIFAMIIQIPEKAVPKPKLSQPAGFSVHDLFDKKAAPYAVTIFILACAYSGISSFLALYANNLDLSAASSYFFLVYAVAMLIFRPFAGRWSDKFGINIIIYPCLILFAVGMFLLSQAHTTAIILIAGAIIGVGYGSITPLFQTQIINSLEPYRVGIANSIYFNFTDIGWAAGAYIWGIVADHTGFRSIFLIGIALIITAGLEYLLLSRRKKVLHVQADFHINS